MNHVRILVHDMDRAIRTFRDRLGFEVGLPQPAVFSEGSAHDVMWLADRTYLEPIAVVDRDKLLKERPWIVDFLDQYEGAQSVGFAIPSAKEFSELLRARGVEAPISTLTPKPGAKPFQHVTPKLPHIPEETIFFTEYPPTTTAPHTFSHPNTAQQILAVWLVAKDLQEASADLTLVGFHPVRQLKSKTLAADGREFAADKGSLILLHANHPGPVAEFAKTRKAGVMGVTLAVADLEKARALIEKNTARKLPTYKGFYGTSFLIPADDASGVWIEMAQQPRSGTTQP